MNSYFDLQVNGYAGVDFNSDGLTVEEVERACSALAAAGVTGILATIISDDIALMCLRLSRLSRIRGQSPLARRIIAGVHIEGPFISDRTGYRGAHPADAVRLADPEMMRRLLDAGDALVHLVTVAPEQDPGNKVTRLLAKAGIAVSAGHTDATLDQLRSACDAGLSVFTHLGNGCPMQMHRHDNIVQRVLSLHERLTICFIADGVHVPLFALRNYLDVAGADRCCVVTDAMSAAGLGPGKYTLGRWEVEVGPDLAAWAPDHSHLVGSAGTMRASEGKLRSIGVSEDACRMMLLENPRRIAGV